MYFTYPNYFLSGTSKDELENLDQIVPMFNDSWNRSRNTLKNNNFKTYVEMFPDSEELKYMYTAGNGGTAQGKTPGNEMKIFDDAGFTLCVTAGTPDLQL